ncbi:uncharacterized protein [Watersipora subatra]|uniref:uncharacterized protein isoform X2 n=1 Tax=Watersipora subatra TaxID=2589382 RepID=UPI00355C0D29
MEDVIEYNFSTEPDWISDAIEFTDTGIELNFKKLNCLCGRGALPRRLCIILEGSFAANNFLAESREQPTEAKKDHMSEVKVTDIKLSKVNGSVNKAAEQELLSVTQSPDASWQPVNNASNFLAVPKEKAKGKGVKRSESVLEREIRLQRVKESEVKTERQQALRQHRRNQLKQERNASDDSSVSMMSSDDSHNSLKDTALPLQISSHENASPTIEINPCSSRNTTEPAKSQALPPVDLKTNDNLPTSMISNRPVTSVTEQPSSKVSPRCSSKLLTSLQRRVINEKAKQNELQLASNAQETPKSRREIRIQMGPVTSVNPGKLPTVTKHQEAAIPSRSALSSAETQHNNSQLTCNASSMQGKDKELESQREKADELRNFGVKV